MSLVSCLRRPNSVLRKATGAYKNELPSSTRRILAFNRFQSHTATAELYPPRRSLPRRAFSVIIIAFVFTTAGFVMASAQAYKAANGMANPPTDEETLSMFTPEDDFAREIEEHIQKHPLANALRQKPEFTESRPHLKISPALRSHSLTAGTLMGENKIVVPPFTWSEDGGKSLVSISYIGSDLCGHPGIVHGGLLATILDEGLARCCFPALPNKVGMTANLNINYRAPAPAGNFVVMRAKTVKVEGRKAWVEGHIETLAGDGEKPTVFVEASALFIEPRQIAAMAKFYPVT